ncbi:MAG: kinase-like domain-containing protein, partial [Piptocephalis tieghemiana]
MSCRLLPSPHGEIFALEVSPFASGSQGSIHRATSLSSGQKCAAKYVADRDLGAIEATYLHSVQGHPNILQLVSTFPDPDRSGWWIITELCDSDLFELIHSTSQTTTTTTSTTTPSSPSSPRPPSLSTRRSILLQVSSALRWCHERGIAHRDVKPENILLCRHPASGRWIVKLADFGLACLAEPSTVDYGLRGTMEYVAPECI